MNFFMAPLPQEVGVESIDRKGCRWHLNHDSKLWTSGREPLRAKLRHHRIEMFARLCEFAWRRHHRQHHLEIPDYRSARQRAQLDPEQTRPSQRQTQSPDTEIRVRFAIHGNAGDGLVASGAAVTPDGAGEAAPLAKQRNGQ
jgi:hypothetical protein